MEISESLTSTALREKVLEKLQQNGIYENYQGNEYHKKSFPRHPGRKNSDDIDDDNGGKRSIYFLNKDIQHLKETLKKPSSIE